MNTFQEYYARDDLAAKLRQTTMSSTTSSSASSQGSSQSSSQPSCSSPDPFVDDEDLILLDSSAFSTTLKPSRGSGVAQQPSFGLQRKRKAEDELSRLLSKQKKGKGLACPVDEPDEVERYLANNHCRYSIYGRDKDYY